MGGLGVVGDCVSYVRLNPFVFYELRRKISLDKRFADHVKSLSEAHMTVYTKFCIMCNQQYMTMKISTVYCSKKCANKARRLPASLKEAIIRRNTKFSMSMLHNVDRDGFIQARQIVELNPMDRPRRTEDKRAENIMLIEHAKSLARARGIDPDAKKVQDLEWNRSANQTGVDENTNVILSSDISVDPEMKDFKLDEDDTGFGSRVLDEEMKAQIYELKENEIPVLSDKKEEQRELSQQQTQPQQPTGLRKFGSLGGNKNGDNNGPKK